MGICIGSPLPDFGAGDGGRKIFFPTQHLRLDTQHFPLTLFSQKQLRFLVIGHDP